MASSSSKFPTTTTSKYPTPSSYPESYSYDVFLSFRGKDTRNNFTGHLYDRLVEVGICTFMDDPQLRKGGEISLQLIRAIEESRIYVFVFSHNYASSRWCLDELVKIINQCDNYRSRVLLPVFYDIQPSDVRGIKGSFEEALRCHEVKYINQPDLVRSWRNALFRAADYSGFDLQTCALGSESRLISLIIKEVLSLVKPRKLFVTKYPVGLDSRVSGVYSLLSHRSYCPAQFIGILGMGGSGKTVIAKALYNKIRHSFESSCFLANVREHSQQPLGLVHLQEKLISRILMKADVKVDIVDEGIEMIRDRFWRKKVLIVLDDLDKASQVDALAGHHDWFRSGSVIIITTRDRHLLNQFQVAVIYEAQELNSEESLELFCWHSFKTGSPQESYAAIAIKIVAYCWGLPLALVVLGSYLGGRPVQEWNSAFESLQKFPPDEIQKILKISYDGLDNDEQRVIFLDIACFFIGIDKDYATEILNGCSFSTEIGIGILKDRCLLTIDKNNELRMHDLLRDMGREIIRQQCPLEPGKRSRLWSHQEAIKVLMRNKGTEAIEGVTLVSPLEEGIHLSTENFVRMHNLRLLKMENVNLEGSFEHLSEEIRWFSSHGCSSQQLPYNWEMLNLAVLDMQHSKMFTVCQDFKFLNLKILNLSHSTRLTSTPDFKRVPRLVTLILKGCTSLLLIHPSIGWLDSLLVLNMEGCEKIMYIPSQICRLRLLQYLNLSGCSNLKELPHDTRKIESLRELYADETGITNLPSLVGLRNLTSLSLKGYTKISAKANMTAIGHLSGLGVIPLYYALRRLNLRDCKLSDEDIPEEIGKYSQELRELDLAGNRLTKLPLSFGKLINIESLWLDNWTILQSFPKLPPNLETLMAKNLDPGNFNTLL